MNMKLSYRDKIIFIVVIVIIILVAGFFLLIKPKFEEVDVAKANLETKQQEKDEIDTKIGTLPQIIENMKTVAKDVDADQQLFFVEQDPYLNEDYIRAILNENGIHIRGITTEYAMANPIQRYFVDPANILTYENKMNADLYNELPQEVWDEYNNVSRNTYPEATIGITSMTVDLTDDDPEYSNTFNFINRIAEDEKSVTLNSVDTETVVMGDEGFEGVDVSIELTLYSIFPMNVDKVLEENADWQQYMNVAPAETPAE